MEELELDFGRDITTALMMTNTTENDRRKRSDLFVAKVAVQAFILGLAIFGNSCLFFAMQKRRRNFTRMHVFITHLCFADMLVAFFNILPQLIWDLVGDWKAGHFMCKFIKFMQVFVMYLSTYVLVLTALDRRRAICSPLLSHTWTYRLVHLSVAGAYLVSAVLSIPQAIIFKYQEKFPGSGQMDCWVHFHPEWTVQLYVTLFTILVYIIPLAILIYSYGSIYYTIFVRYKQTKQSCQVQDGNSTQLSTFGLNNMNENDTSNQKAYKTHMASSLVPRSSSFAGFTRAKMKTVKFTLVIIIAYIACWSPFFISQLWWLYDEDAPRNNRAIVIMVLLASLNSCCNPWIYMAFSGTFSCCRYQDTKRCSNSKTKQPYGQRKSSFFKGFRRNNTKSTSTTTTPFTRTQSLAKLVVNNQIFDPYK